VLARDVRMLIAHHVSGNVEDRMHIETEFLKQRPSGRKADADMRCMSMDQGPRTAGRPRIYRQTSLRTPASPDRYSRPCSDMETLPSRCGSRVP
jgi:hypothetical protein